MGASPSFHEDCACGCVGDDDIALSEGCGAAVVAEGSNGEESCFEAGEDMCFPSGEWDIGAWEEGRVCRRDDLSVWHADW